MQKKQQQSRIQDDGKRLGGVRKNRAIELARASSFQVKLLRGMKNSNKKNTGR